MKAPPLYVGLLVLIAILPLSMISHRPMMWTFPLIAAYALAAAWLMQYLRHKVNTTATFLRGLPVVLLLTLTMLWMLFQAVVPDLSSDPHATWYELIKSGAYLSIFCLCLLLIHDRKQLEMLVWVIVIGGVAQVLIKVIWGTHGTYVNRNHFAGYLEMAVACAIGLMLSRLNRSGSGGWRVAARNWVQTFLGPKVIIRILLVVLVIGLILSRSRMGNTAFFGSMFIAGAIGLFAFRSVSRNALIFFTSILVIDVLLMGAFFGIDKLQQRFESLDIAEDGRLFLSEYTLRMWESDWLAGVGSGAFSTLYPYFRDHRVAFYYNHAHNDFLQLPAELGAIGASFLGLCVLYALATAVRVQMQRRSLFMKSMGFASTMGIVAILIHSTADFNLQMIGNAGTFMVLLAIPFLAMTLERDSNQGV